MQRCFDHFPHQQITVRLCQDDRDDAQTRTRDPFAFIGADPGCRPHMRGRLNAGGVPKYRAKRDFLVKSNPIARAIGLVLPQGLRLAIRDRTAAANTVSLTGTPDETRDILKDRLRDDIARLQHLIDRDLGHWLR